jgi:outer membrane immunogenic protein
MLGRLLGVLGFSSLLIALPLSGASAADMPTKAPPLTPPAPTWSWQGIYLGLNGGGSNGTTDWQYFSALPATAGTPIGTADHTFKGGLYGATAGYNWQWSPYIVTGIEGDIDMGPLDGNTGCPIAIAAGFSCQTHITNIGTFRGRIGLAFDRVLIYGTGGLAFADVTIRTANLAGVGQLPSGNAINGTSDERAGWAAGAGIEFFVLSSVSLKAEWIHYDLSTTTYEVDNPATQYVQAREFGDIYKAGVNWHFPSGPPGPAHY